MKNKQELIFNTMIFMYIDSVSNTKNHFRQEDVIDACVELGVDYDAVRHEGSKRLAMMN